MTWPAERTGTTADKPNEKGPADVVRLAAIALALLCIAVIEIVPRWFLELTPTFATGLITAGLFVSAGRNDVAPVFYFLVVLYAFNFFPTRTTRFAWAVTAVFSPLGSHCRPSAAS